MNREYEEGRKVRRFAPVPEYDIAGTESWLGDLAEEGLFLTKDGFFADIAAFESRTPRRAKYRLEAVKDKEENYPDPEQIRLGEKYSWEYICKRGDFFIFRSFDPSARELNTDPAVQALALNVVRKKKLDSFISALLILLLYPVTLTRGCILLTTMYLGLPWMAAALITGVYEAAERGRAFFHLKRIQKELTENGYYESESSWRKSLAPYQIKRNASLIVTVILCASLLKAWVGAASIRKTPIGEYDQPLPFAVVSDFAGDGGSDYQRTMEDFLEGSINVVWEMESWVSPRYIEYNEHAMITDADGNRINGGLYVDYVETRYSWMANMIAKELYLMEKVRHFEGTVKTEPLDLDADSVICYTNLIHAPAVIIQKGNIVVRAYFYQSGPGYQMAFAEWAEIMCRSISDQD